MRNLNSMMTSVLMPALMIFGVRYVRSTGQRWLTNGGTTITATTPSTMRVHAVTSMREKSEQPTPAIRPIPDVISAEVKSGPESQRHVASLHPEMITPGDFEYLGAFLPPHFEDNLNSFAYSPGTQAIFLRSRKPNRKNGSAAEI